MSNNIIQWYENAAFDKPELRSPQPCPRGVYCQYKIPNKETQELEIACCRMVHPGEEGNGRRLFPARSANGRQQPACVRLTGNAGFYERCRLKQPWRVWAAEHNIPLPPADVPWVPVTRGPIQRGSKTSVYNEQQMDAFRGLADYNDHVSRQETKEYLRRKAAGIPSDFDVAKQQFPELFESLREGVSAAPTSWPSLQSSGGGPIPAPIYFTPQPPPRLNLRPQLDINYGFSAAERYVEECSTPSLLTPVLDESLRAEGAMEAID